MIKLLKRVMINKKGKDLLSNLQKEESQRILHLQKNQWIGQRCLGRSPNGKNKYPNCYGTVIDIKDKKGQLVKLAEDISSQETRNGYKGYIKCEEGISPPHIEGRVFDKMLDTPFFEESEADPGRMVVIFYNGRDGSVHSGIYVGEGIFFDQFNIRGIFRFYSLDGENLKNCYYKFYEVMV